jgi:hypothetical protein
VGGVGQLQDIGLSPHRVREIRGIASIGFAVTASTTLYYALLSASAPVPYLLAVLGLSYLRARTA